MATEVALRRCLDCPRFTPDSRCPEHKRTKQQAKDAKRPDRRTYVEQERRREQVRAQPWCSVCGATEDLTAGHLQDVAVTGREDGPLTTLCRHHNSSSGATVRRAAG